MTTATMPATLAPAIYHRLPGDIRALRFMKANVPALDEWLTASLGAENFMIGLSGGRYTLDIVTPEGTKHVPVGYWVAEGTHGEFYTIPNKVFVTNYGFGASA